MRSNAYSTDPINYDAYPDESGHFGPYGGKFVPETLMPALDELEEAYLKAMGDQDFLNELAYLQRTYVGRPTPITYAQRLSQHLGGAQIYLKREDLAHTGAHKINNALGQALLMKRKMGKTRIVAETGAGQHGVATATAAALLGIECVVYMGSVDMARQEPNVFRMRLLGTDVRAVESGSRTLKDAINEAIRDWVTNVRSTQRTGTAPLPCHGARLPDHHRTRSVDSDARQRGWTWQDAGRYRRMRWRRQQRHRDFPSISQI